MRITIHISDETKPEVVVETGRGRAVPPEAVDKLNALAQQLEDSPADDTPTYAIAAELRNIAKAVSPGWRVDHDDMTVLADRVDTWLYNHKGVSLQPSLETLLRDVETELRTAAVDIMLHQKPRF